jgi:MEKHLA domain
MIESILSRPSTQNNYHQEHVSMMLANLKRWTSYDLIEEYGFSVDRLGEEVFNANFYLLSHNNATDPILNYGNSRVLELWEVSWEELTNMYSRDTAKPVDRSARSSVMDRVKQYNYISGYDGIRVSKTGKEFKILDVTIWNLFLNNGDAYGQAAWFKSIEFCGN